MTDPRTIVERELDRVELRPFNLDAFHTRRERERRNRRIGTAVLALAVAAAAIGGLAEAIRRAEPSPSPADLPSTPGAWVRVSLGSSGESVSFIVAGGPGLVAVGTNSEGDSLVWTSSDGHTWTSIPGEGLGLGQTFDVTAGGPGLVAVGDSGETETREGPPGAAGFHSAVWTSANGRRWSRVADNKVFGYGLMQAVTGGGPGLVAVGLWNRAWFSSDGVTWERASVPWDAWVRGVSLVDVAASGGRLVAVGWSTRENEVDIWTSTDGIAWTNVPGINQRLDTDVFPHGTFVRSVVGGPNGFVAVGEERLSDPTDLGGGPPAVWTSPDGLHWRRVPPGQDAFVSRVPARPDRNTMLLISSVASGTDGYVAVGTDGHCTRGGRCSSAEAGVWTSPDGKAWVRVPSAPIFRVDDPSDPKRDRGADAYQVVPWGNRFVVVGQYDGQPTVWISDPP